jgi:hypothetical protein
MAAPHALPELPPELVTSIMTFIPIAAIPQAALVATNWAVAARSEAVWLAVLRRRWDITSLDCFGARFPSWRSLFVALSTLPPPREDTLSNEERDQLASGEMIELHALSRPARLFLLGIARDGFFPTADGLFTYHEEGATPVHYRHTLSDACALEEYERGALRLGGEWEWSCDRLEWLPTSTTHISRGQWGGIRPLGHGEARRDAAGSRVEAESRRLTLDRRAVR